MKLTARQYNYFIHSTLDTDFSLNCYTYLFIKNGCMKVYFFKASCKDKHQVNQKYSSSELQLLNPQTPIQNIFQKPAPQKEIDDQQHRKRYINTKQSQRYSQTVESGTTRQERTTVFHHSLVWIYQKFPFINSAVQKKPNLSSSY